MARATDHVAADHPVGGSPREVMRAVVARHLCGWISGHDAPVDHFLADAELMLADADAAGVVFARRIEGE